MVKRFTTDDRGNAAIEFVWAVIVLVPILLFIFQIFQATMHSSGGLVKARLKGFTALDSVSGVGHKSIVYTNHAGSSYEEPTSCTDDCTNKLNFTYVEPPRRYPYGLGQFDMQVDRSFVVMLQ